MHHGTLSGLATKPTIRITGLYATHYIVALLMREGDGEIQQGSLFEDEVYISLEIDPEHRIGIPNEDQFPEDAVEVLLKGNLAIFLSTQKLATTTVLQSTDVVEIRFISTDAKEQLLKEYTDHELTW
jgi:hypothetical protein